MSIWHILVVPAPKFGGGTTEVVLAGKIRLFCKRLYLGRNSNLVWM